MASSPAQVDKTVADPTEIAQVVAAVAAVDTGMVDLALAVIFVPGH